MIAITVCWDSILATTIGDNLMLFVLVSKATTQHLSNKDAAFVFPVLQGDAENLVA